MRIENFSFVGFNGKNLFRSRCVPFNQKTGEWKYSYSLNPEWIGNKHHYCRTNSFQFSSFVGFENLNFLDAFESQTNLRCIEFGRFWLEWNDFQAVKDEIGHANFELKYHREPIYTTGFISFKFEFLEEILQTKMFTTVHYKQMKVIES